MSTIERDTDPRAAPATVAVAVVSYNTRELLDACLASLRPDVECGLAEVWVVDNCSTDGSASMVGERHPWVKLDLPGVNLGFGRAVNRVALRTSAPWIAPANADIELTPGALAELVEAGRRHADAAAIGPRLVLPDGSIQASVQLFPGLRATLRATVALTPRARARRTGWDSARAGTVPWITGAFLVVRRSAFMAVGGFDEDVWMYGEDLDLCWRLAQAGWVTRYEPSAVLRHHESAASREAFGDALPERWMRATWGWMARRRGIAETWATAAVAAANALARLAVVSALALRAPERWEPRRQRARAALRYAALGLRSRAALLRGGGP